MSGIRLFVGLAVIAASACTRTTTAATATIADELADATSTPIELAHADDAGDAVPVAPAPQAGAPGATASTSEPATADGSAAIAEPVGGESLSASTGCLLISTDQAEGPVELFDIETRSVQMLAANAFNARFSPDGSSVALVAEGDERLVLRVVGLDGTVILESDLAERLVVNPVWSPDGEWLAFTTIQAIGDSSATSHLWVTPTDAFDPVVLSPAEFSIDVSPSWSPNSDAILVANLVDSPTSLALSSTTGERSTVELDLNASWPSWSPIDDSIVFVGSEEPYGENDLYVTDVEGSRLRQLTSGLSISATLSWSPDGRHVAYVARDETGRADLRIVDLQTTESWAIGEHDSDSPWGAVWSPDGTSLSFTNPHGDVVVSDLDGSTTLVDRQGLVTGWSKACDSAG